MVSDLRLGGISIATGNEDFVTDCENAKITTTGYFLLQSGLLLRMDYMDK